MAQMLWGLAGPSDLRVERRTRTLGLGATVRAFNDLAVPGIGGVWFGKQVFLALLGIVVAEEARARGKKVQNIEVANAIEALACWFALKGNNWTTDPRVRGRLKMAGKQDLSFSQVRKKSFYVAQPMRPSTLQPLRALRFVDATGERFNSFTASDLGREFVNTAVGNARPYSKPFLAYLISWVCGEEMGINSPELRKLLSTLDPLPPHARSFLREQLICGESNDRERRRAALKWMSALRDAESRLVQWQNQPAEIENSHWKDLIAGAHLFNARDAAIELLKKIEVLLSDSSERRIDVDDTLVEKLASHLSAVRQRSVTFLELDHDPSPEGTAKAFCQECSTFSDSDVIINILKRDERVLLLRENAIVQGPAFRGRTESTTDSARSPEDDGAEIAAQVNVIWPEGISQRIRNLFLLNADLDDQLKNWVTNLSTATEGV